MKVCSTLYRKVNMGIFSSQTKLLDVKWNDNFIALNFHVFRKERDILHKLFEFTLSLLRTLVIDPFLLTHAKWHNNNSHLCCRPFSMLCNFTLISSLHKRLEDSTQLSNSKCERCVQSVCSAKEKFNIVIVYDEMILS